MKLQESVLPIAEEPREELNAKTRPNIAPGTKLIVGAVALLAGGMVLYGIGSKVGVFGSPEQQAPAPKGHDDTPKLPSKPPKLDVPANPGTLQPQNNAQQTEQRCPGGEVLPPGMPMTLCPQHAGAVNQQQANTGGTNATGAAEPGPHDKVLKPTPEDLRVRRLGGDVAVSANDAQPDDAAALNAAYAGANRGLPNNASGAGGLGGSGAGGQPGGQNQTALGASLVSTVTAKATASFIMNQDFLLAKGSLPDCTLRTAIRTSVSGFIQCVLAAPARSMNGTNVLLPMGTVINGEYNGTVSAGQRSIFTMWSDARTPEGVVVNLGSPGTDQLGRAGTDGYVDNKWMERYAGAVFYSLFDDVMNIQLAKASSSNGSNNVSLYPSSTGTSKAIVEEMLKEGSSIKPDLYKNQGEVVKIFIARDVDFSTVYRMRSTRPMGTTGAGF